MDRERALRLVRNAIVGVGYDEKAIKYNYKFIGEGKEIQTAEMVVFGDARKCDLSTACISVEWNEQIEQSRKIVNKHRYLATPLVILPGPDDTLFYDLRKSDRPSNVSYDLLEQHFSKNRLSFSKESLLKAKNSPEFIQMVLFAAEATQDSLVRLFEDAIRREQQQQSDHPNVITRVAVHILAACIIEDKLFDQRASNAKVLLHRCAQRFPNYFQGILSNAAREQIAERIYNAIRPQLTFQALTSQTLGYLYEYAILSQDVRNYFGVHSTSEKLAELIVKNLPFELIPREEMYVLDGTCGSGSLLLAACERMANLLPVRMNKQQQHDWLTKRVIGVEIETLASETARLSLLMYGLPYGNKWKIINTDFFKFEIPKPPTIIVANPPFKESRTDEKAARFVDRYLEILSPGGLMGIILPASFLESRKCKATRLKLLEKARLLEIWHLPENAFRTSSIAATVILLRKLEQDNSNKDYLVRIIEINKKELEIFQKTGISSKVYHVNVATWFKDNSIQINSSPLEFILSSLNYKRTLGNVAKVSQGIIPGPNCSSFSEIDGVITANGKYVKWLQSPKNGVLEPYGINWQLAKRRQFILYPGPPGSIYRDRKSVPFEERKIIVNAVRNYSSYWRLYGTIDEEGFFVSQSFFVIYNSTIPLEQIVAVLNSPLASLFINKLNRRSYIQKSNLLRIPIPVFTTKQEKVLEQLVKQTLSLKRDQPLGWDSKVRDLVKRIDDIVFDAFNLSENSRRTVIEYFKNKKRPGSEWINQTSCNVLCKPESLVKKTWKVFGIITAIDINRGTVSLSLDEYKGPQSIPIPPQLPGWGLEPGCTFEAEIPFDQRYEQDLSRIQFLSFRLIDYNYLSDQELSLRTKFFTP